MGKWLARLREALPATEFLCVGHRGVLHQVWIFKDNNGNIVVIWKYNGDMGNSLWDGMGILRICN